MRALLAAPLLLAGLAGGPAVAAEPLQPILDAATPGATITLKPGVYAGPAVIRKTLTLEGTAGAVLDGAGSGTVLTIEANGGTVRNLVIRASGRNHDQLDACVKVRASFVVVKDNTLVDCLFGIDLQQASNVILRRNDIGGVDHELGQRGEAIRLWYSDDNLIEANRVHDSRDTAIWYSKNNRILGNVVERGRYGIHFMYSHHNLVAKNRLVANTVGIFLMYSNDIEVRDNDIHSSQGPSGIGLGFKETSGAKIVGNHLFGNAVGVYLDASPYDPDSENLFEGNRIAFNGTSLHFHSDWTGNRFLANAFTGNHLEVAVDGGGGATRNVFAGNHFDGFEGFDRNRDGVGDTPFEVWAWSDRLWMDVTPAQFFRASPALEAIDFVERLAPLTQPRLLLRDETPAVRAPRLAGEPPARSE